MNFTIIKTKRYYKKGMCFELNAQEDSANDVWRRHNVCNVQHVVWENGVT